MSKHNKVFIFCTTPVQRTSQSSALAVGDLPVKLIHGDFDVRLTLGDGALQVLLDV